MKSLSEQLADLSQRAKRAEDDVAVARSEAHAKVLARIEQVKADAATRAADMKVDAASKRNIAAEHWAAMQKQIQERGDRLHAGGATFNADRAEEDAVDAIAFALTAIDVAELAVLTAVDARANADTLKIKAGEPAQHA